jgi:hypothetical protein
MPERPNADSDGYADGTDSQLVGPPGILVGAGATFAIQNLELRLSPDGKFSSSIEPKLAWEIWPFWLRIAIEYEADAMRARTALLEAPDLTPEGDQQRARCIESETQAGLVTISACAFTIEAMALSAGALAGINDVGSSTSSAKRACEVLKQCFDLPQFLEWRAIVIKSSKVGTTPYIPTPGSTIPFLTLL